MDIPFRQYLDEKFADLNSRLDRMDDATRGRHASATREIDGLQERVRELEVRTGVVETTRPTHTQLVAAAAGGMTLGTTVATLLVMIIF